MPVSRCSGALPALGALDCAAFVYLVLYARHRERRDPDAVLAVGYFLIVCAVVLVGLDLLLLLLLGRDAVLGAVSSCALVRLCGSKV